MSYLDTPLTSPPPRVSRDRFLPWILVLLGAGSALAVAMTLTTVAPRSMTDSIILGGFAIASIFGVLGFLLGRAINAAHAKRLNAYADELWDLATSFVGRSECRIGGPALMAGMTTAAAPARAQAGLRAVSRAFRAMQVERDHARAKLDNDTVERKAFFSRLSHEIRTPLNAIMGYSSILIETADAKGLVTISVDLRRIRRAGETLLGQIDNLLVMVEDKVDGTAQERAPISIRGLLTSIASRIGCQSEYGRMTLSDDSAGGDITLFSHRDKVNRAVQGMFDHAVKFRGARSLRYSASIASGDRVRILVIADNFANARSERRSVEKNGSAFVNDVLARLVGAVLVMEEREDGTWAYQLDIPLDVSKAGPPIEPEESSMQAIQRHGAHEPSRKKKKALVIDDDPAAIDLLTRWLKRCDYQVVSARNAADGLEMACRDPVDIVLLDALMPGKSGYEVLPELRAQPQLTSTPILIVTVDDDRARGLEAGASDFVRKPVTETELRRIISVYDTDLSGDVLIIEDEDDAAELLNRTVRRMGFSTRRAVDGQSGLDAVKNRPPKAILLDLNMPGVNGFEFIERLASHTELAAIPLIVVSGQDLSISQHHSLVSAGARFYLKGDAAPREIAEGLREAVG